MSYTSNWCPTCNEYMGSWMGPHKCPPQWEGWTPDEADALGIEEYATIYTVFAANAEAAAAMVCERLDRDESPLCREVYVRPLGSTAPAELWDMDYTISVQYSGRVKRAA